MVDEAFLQKVLAFEGLSNADIFSVTADALVRGWTELSKVMDGLSGWERVTLSDGFPMYKPVYADEKVGSYVSVRLNAQNVPLYETHVLLEDLGPYDSVYASYECMYAGDVVPLLVAFGV